MSSAALALFFLCMLLDRVLLNPTARRSSEAELCEWMDLSYKRCRNNSLHRNTRTDRDRARARSDLI